MDVIPISLILPALQVYSAIQANVRLLAREEHAPHQEVWDLLAEKIHAGIWI
jgi:hypothetical protein